MSFRALVAVWMLLAPLISEAQTVSVRAGEHPGFSRLVIDFPTMPEWMAGRIPEGYGLRVSAPDITYDLSEVFRKIPRTRIQAVRADADARMLRLAVTCACRLEAFVAGRASLVIDIRDGDPDPASPFEIALTQPPGLVAPVAQIGAGAPDMPRPGPFPVVQALAADLSPGPAGAPDERRMQQDPGPLRDAARSYEPPRFLTPPQAGGTGGLAPAARPSNAPPPRDGRATPRIAIPANAAARTPGRRTAKTRAEKNDAPGIEPAAAETADQRIGRVSRPVARGTSSKTAADDAASRPVAAESSLVRAPVQSAFDWAGQARGGGASALADGFQPGDRRAGPADLTAAVAEQLARAAAQGLIRADPGAIDRRDFNARRDLSDRTGADELPQAGTAPRPGALQSQSNVRVQTSVDRDLGGNDGLRGTTPTGGVCLPASLFETRKWGNAGDATTDIARLRSKLVGEFDIPRSEDVLALARLYIALGFGQEARAVLDEFQVAVAEAPLLIAMADIVDEIRTDRPAEIADQLGCQTPGALWAALARTELPQNELIAEDAIMSAFSALPIHLRRHLGPELSQRFLSLGDTVTARTLRNAIVRAPGELGDGVALLDARLTLQSGQVELARAQLDVIASSESALAPDALIALIETKLRAGASVSADIIDSAAALAFETKATPLGRKLKSTEIQARIANGSYLEAVGELERAVGNELLAQETAQELMVQAYLQAISLSSNEVFLRLAFLADQRLGGSADLQVRRAVADRLLALGFAAQARALLAAADPDVSRDRVRLAEIAFQLGNIPKALGLLRDSDAPGALQLRAEILAQSGDHAAAAAVFDALGQAQRSQQEAWRAGDWDSVRRGNDDVKRAAAALVFETPLERVRAGANGGEDPAVPETAGNENADATLQGIGNPPAGLPDTRTEQRSPPGSGNRELIEYSTEMRERLNALLDSTRLPAF